MDANQRSCQLLKDIHLHPAQCKAQTLTVGGARIVDFGVECQGGLEAGLLLARATCGDLANVNLVSAAINQQTYPAIQYSTDQPLWACMGCQYAGWPVQHEGFFAMASGPARLLRGKEKVLEEFELVEPSSSACICLESSKIPAESVVEAVAAECSIDASQLTVAIAPTSSIAGSVQVVARSVETALHKLHELDFDISKVVSGVGVAPIPPIANDDLKGIGLTNDSILFGGKVDLWVRVDQKLVDEIGPLLPSSASNDYGTPFYELFKQKEFDFYKIDPHLFSPASVTIHNLESGVSKTFGELNHELLNHSFGI